MTIDGWIPDHYLFSELTLEGITPRRGGLCIIIFYSIFYYLQLFLHHLCKSLFILSLATLKLVSVLKDWAIHPRITNGIACLVQVILKRFHFYLSVNHS